MSKAVIILLVVMVVGLATAAWVATSSQESIQTVENAALPMFDKAVATDDRILALEHAVREEREARQALEDELFVLMEDVEALRAARSDGRRTRSDDEGNGVAVASTLGNRTAFFGRGRAPEDVKSALVRAGFSAERAEWIQKRESELQMELMQAAFEARASGEPIDISMRSGPDAMLRDEIGDSEYEMYLQANNRPTSVGIDSILESSPAQQVGLQSGDEIVGYDGERVFNVWELTQNTMQGTPGENVVVDVVRNGAPMQVVVPRGPIGISAGRGSIAIGSGRRQ